MISVTGVRLASVPVITLSAVTEMKSGDSIIQASI